MALGSWITAKFLGRAAGVLISSGPVIKASREIIKRLRKEASDSPDADIKGLLLELEARLQNAETGITELHRVINRLEVAVYASGAIALLALVFAVIKLVSHP